MCSCESSSLTGFGSRIGSFVAVVASRWRDDLLPLAGEIRAVVGFRMISVANDSKLVSPYDLHSCTNRLLQEATSDHRKVEHYQPGVRPSSQTLTDGKIPPSLGCVSRYC